MAIFKRHSNDGYLHCRVTTGPISPKDEYGRREVVWSVGKDKKRYTVHLICPHCYTINDVTQHTGEFACHADCEYPETCLVCIDCGRHTFFNLRGWGMPEAKSIPPAKTLYCPAKDCLRYTPNLYRPFSTENLWKCPVCKFNWRETKKGLVRL